MVLQPVKPTAVKPKIENNNTSLPTIITTTTSLNNNNNTSTASVAASQNPSTKPLITSTPSKNQQSAAQILANNTNNNSIQSPSTIIPTPIAFSAVAKQNPGESNYLISMGFHDRKKSNFDRNLTDPTKIQYLFLFHF